MTDSTEGQPTRYLEADQRIQSGPVFTPDSKSLVYSVREKGVDNLWIEGLGGTARRPLTNFTKDIILRYAYSPDGKQIALERGEIESDAYLFRDTSK